MRKSAVIIAVGMAVAAAGLAWGQQPASRSSGPAAALVKLMSERGLDAVAARDPSGPDRFVAALCFPGTQLLVVSGKFPVPAALDARLSDDKYRDVYLDLQGEVAADGRFFVQDMQADGLKIRPADGDAFDLVYENGLTTTTFDGNHRNPKLSQAEYEAKFAAADRRYAAMLTVLTEALRTAR